MSQLSLNQTNQSLVTDPDSVKKTGFFRNCQSRAKNRIGTPKVNEDNISVCTAGESSRVHKLGYLPSYLKKETKSSVESELFTKYKKFKIAKKDLIQQQTNLKQHFEQLRVLKEKFKRFGGRDFKIESLELIEFTGGGHDNGCGDGDGGHDILRSGISKPLSNSTDNQIHEFEQVIDKIRGRVKDCLCKLIESNCEVFKQIQESGTEELKNNCHTIFLKIQEYVDSAINEHNVNTQHLLEKVQRLRIPLPEETYEGHSTKDAAFQEEIVGLKKTVQNLEVQGKMLLSEIDVKNQEIEYLINKESCRNNVQEQNELHSEIQAQNAVITDYSVKFDQYSKQQEINEEQIRQLEDKVLDLNVQLQDNLLKHDTDLSIEREKYDELERKLEEVKNTKCENLQTNGSNYESVSNKLTAANEDIKELQFKICKREKQIQNLKHILNSESNKSKEYDHLLLKYDELRQQEHCKSQEIHQLKEKLVLRSDTINSQILTISELKKMLMTQGTVAVEHSKNIGPLQEEQTSKFTKQEKLIEKLENNKIRSNVLRDQFLDRISMLEKENEDMKAQIRKFHEDFTINRFMYDEQRRKKRLTEILVKQYQN